MTPLEQQRSWTTRRRPVTASLLGVLVVAALLSACSPDEEGSARVAVGVSALSADQVSRLTVTVTGPGIDAAIVTPLYLVNDEWQGMVDGIPAGTDRTFVAEAYAGSELAYVGRASGVSIVPGEAAVVLVVLQQHDAPTPFTNSAPVIDSLVASTNAVAPGGQIELVLSAHDADAGDAMTISWGATGGTFSDPTSATPTWTAPSTAGAMTLTVSVTDSKAATQTLSLDVAVSTGATDGSAALHASLNTWPVVSGLIASPATVDAGGSTTLDLSAGDLDGDQLTFLWSDGDCGGSFDNVRGEDPTWTAPAVLASSTCTLSVAIADGRGGSNTASLTISMGSGPVVNIAPAITSTFQSDTSIGANADVVLKVAASDPEGHALNFAWSTGTGTLSAATTTATTSEVSWTAPDTGCDHTITVTVDDGAGGTTQTSFEVTIDSTQCAPACPTWYEDRDGDGFGNLSSPQGSCTQPAGYVADATDCNDADRATNPGAVEICDGVDNNCDGAVDPDGACQACGPGNCSGCCDGNGVCQPGTEANVCGVSGGTCATCDLADACMSGVCTSFSTPLTCSDLAPLDDGSGPVRQALVISEIKPGQYIEVFNASSAAITLGTSSYILIGGSPPATIRSIAGSITLAARGYATLGWPDGFTQTTASGDLMLYLDQIYPPVVDKVMDYVCWGAGGGNKSGAEAAGKWVGPCASAITGGSIHRVPGTRGIDAASYDTVRPPSPETCSP